MRQLRFIAVLFFVLGTGFVLAQPGDVLADSDALSLHMDIAELAASAAMRSCGESDANDCPSGEHEDVG